MINKFQQGGKQDPVMLFVQGIAQVLQTDPQQVAQLANQHQQEFAQAYQIYQQTNDIQQAAQTFVQGVQSKKKSMKHGAKLNYIKSLKHQCAEDEELVYYKKGGSVGCGCKKKEDGGEIKKASKGSVVDEFKSIRKAGLGDILDATGSQGGFRKAREARRKKEKEAERREKIWGDKIKKGQRGLKQDQATTDSIKANVHNDQEIQDTKPGTYKKDPKTGKLVWVPDRTKAPYKKDNGSKVVAKFKKHYQGGNIS